MKYTVIEERNYFPNKNDGENDWKDDEEDGWGFFVELDEQSVNPIKFKNLKKYYHSPIPQTMETIREYDCEDWHYNDDDKKKEKTITSQIYSGVAICALAAYVCFMV